MKKKILIFYIVLLLVFVVIKFNGNVNGLIATINSIKSDRNEGVWNINLTSFTVLKRYLRTMINDIISGDLTNYATLNILGNIVPFIPFGLLIPVNFKKINSFFKFFLVSSLFIITIELFQLITLLGYCDIQDYILNIIGCFIGYIIYTLNYNLSFKKRQE